MIFGGGVPPAGPPPVEGPAPPEFPGRTSRWTIFGATALAATAVVMSVLIGPAGTPVDGLVNLAAIVLSVVANIASMVVRRRLVPPVGLIVQDGSAFLVPPHRGYSLLAAGQLTITGYLAGQGINMWQEFPDDWVFVAMTVVSILIAAMIVVIVAPMAVAALRGLPRLELTPHGVTVRNPLGTGTIPWAALAPGHPERQAATDRLTLTVARPELVVRRGLGLWIPGTLVGWPALSLMYLAVHPWFLADVIRHYVDHPERRAAIGDRAEYQRLLGVLGVPLAR